MFPNTSNIESLAFLSKKWVLKINLLFNNSYYFESNGTFYRSNIKYEDSATKLFSIDKVSDWKIVDNNLLIMSNDTLYLYNDEIGLKKIISNNEFKYNYNNIYNLYID
jgi:hypothetical protein